VSLMEPGIAIVDTSVFVEILDVPGFNNNRDQLLDLLVQAKNARWTLILPLAAMIEAGNHIGHLADGHNRRVAAERFVQQVHAALEGEAPWGIMPLPDTQQLREIMTKFPDRASGNLGMGDQMMLAAWNLMRLKASHQRVLIWSLDNELSSYDNAPSRTGLRFR